MSVMTFVRNAIEKEYIGRCDVVEYQKTINPTTKKTEFNEVVVLENQKCRLSFSSSPASDDGNTSALAQEIKLFIAPEIEIKEGSKIIVTQNKRTDIYSNSGHSALYETHQEIKLELFKGWA